MGAVGALEVFTATLERLVRVGTPQREIVEPLARLVAEDGWLDGSKTRLNDGGPAALLLAKADDQSAYARDGA